MYNTYDASSPHRSQFFGPFDEGLPLKLEDLVDAIYEYIHIYAFWTLIIERACPKTFYLNLKTETNQQIRVRVTVFPSALALTAGSHQIQKEARTTHTRARRTSTFNKIQHQCKK